MGQDPIEAAEDAIIAAATVVANKIATDTHPVKDAGESLRALASAIAAIASERVYRAQEAERQADAERQALDKDA